MNAIQVLEYTIALGGTLFLFSYLLIRYFASPRTSCAVQSLATLAFALAFTGTLLLPIDLSLKYGQQQEEEARDDDGTVDVKDMLWPWHVLFWCTFLMGFLILPWVRHILLSGEFTAMKRLKNGLRRMLLHLCVLFVVLTVLICYLAISLRELNVIPVLITFGNTYGLLMVSVLLGYGLVALPRSLWRQAKPDLELRRTYIMAVAADEALYEAVWDLQDCEYAIDSAISKIEDLDEGYATDRYYTKCVNDLLQRKNDTIELSQDLHTRRTSSARGEDGGARNGPFNNKPTMSELVQLNRDLKRAQEKLYSAQQQWDSVVHQNMYLSAMVPGGSNGTQIPASSFGWRIKHCWMTYLRSSAFRFLSIITGCISGIILWSEATLGLKYNVSPFAWIQEYVGLEDGDNKGILFQVTALIPLLYMSICVARSLFMVTMFTPFCLRGNRQSHGVSLMFNSQFLVRLQFPLGYNYLLMLKYDTSTTAFSDFIGQMEVVPLFGTTFSVYAPLLVIAVCALTFLDVHTRILSFLGFQHEDAILVGDQETLDIKVSEGIRLLKRHMDSVEHAELAMGIATQAKSFDSLVSHSSHDNEPLKRPIV